MSFMHNSSPISMSYNNHFFMNYDLLEKICSKCEIFSVTPPKSHLFSSHKVADYASTSERSVSASFTGSPRESCLDPAKKRNFDSSRLNLFGGCPTQVWILVFFVWDITPQGGVPYHKVFIPTSKSSPKNDPFERSYFLTHSSRDLLD
jgi:hypothetical protein